MKELAKLNEKVTELYETTRNQAINDKLYRSEQAKSFLLGQEDAYRTVLDLIHEIYFNNK